MTRLAVFVATVAYCGLFPVAPGTAGSAGRPADLCARLVDAVFRARDGTHRRAFCGRCLGWHARGAALPGGSDPGPVVIDEVVGMLITLAFIPVGWPAALTGFVLFRIFDIIKPYPAGKFERLHGGLGIMADDAMAAVYAISPLRLLNLQKRRGTAVLCGRGSNIPIWSAVFKGLNSLSHFSRYGGQDAITGIMS